MGLKYEMEQRLNLPKAFGGTFVFFSTHKPTLKKSKRATKLTHNNRTNNERNNHDKQKGSL